MSAGNEAREDVAAERFRIAGLIGLLVLSVVWPAPVLWLNDLTFGAELRIDRESFLGREAAEWDVAFWWIAGLFGLLAVGRDRASLHEGKVVLMETLGRVRPGIRRSLDAAGTARVTSIAVTSLVAIALALLVVDARLLGWLVSLDQSGWLEWTSLINRAGGGIAPGLATLFIGIVGVTCANQRWIRLFVAIVLASLLGGVLLHSLKLVGRVRPELFRALFELEPGSGASFPSGHTFSAFVVATAIAMISRSALVRVSLPVAACLIGATRVLTFRHWPSDVMFSALLGVILAWLFVSATEEIETSSARGT